MSGAEWIYEGHWRIMDIGGRPLLSYEASGKDQRIAEISLKIARDPNVWEADFLVRVPRIKGAVNASRILAGEFEKHAQTSSMLILKDFATAPEALS